ncbi:replication-associated recombination protein A [Catenovulum sp. 2E275]|uniref:replication-associated recombination protein A n=1 Tax=Catenovulum sp. 2E275 TaxID=2980497 RepID=UPI0021CFF20B|nr:replication-associated recombination protein A [Catenovulum sp. 2E275]MCU4676004.1 replication-associated recombination protein A [Catenovulum sp. 2E275]
MTNAADSGLFDSVNAPLAARMRPVSLDQYIGQSHILAKDKPLYKAVTAGRVHSLILWGPPGTGKTTLAELIARYVDAHVERLSAVTAGVKDIRAAIDSARLTAQQSGRKTVLFVDEVHRFNKSQQDAFLPFIEDGTVIFIGATTENPGFELNRALLSRARVYLLQKHSTEELMALLAQVKQDPSRSGDAASLTFADKIAEQLIDYAAGDARQLLNQLEILTDLIEPNEQGERLVLQQHIETLLQYRVVAADKGGDLYYDLISAFHKSVRGSDPDAALYWYARMLSAGIDPLYVARRLLAIASEDIGNADPRAMQIALNAWDCFTRVGPAEGERAIAQAAVFMACAPKSNAVYTAFKAALKDARELPSYDVPYHLRNAPTAINKSLGHGAEYRYAHNEDNAYAAGEVYMPVELKQTQYYFPSERGLEKKIGEKLAYLAGLDANSEQKRYE